MNIECRKKDNILIVTMEGDIDHHTCEKLRSVVDDTLEQIRGKHILFCFSKVSFMDSSGIGVLIGRYKLVQRLHGKIAVFGAGERIKEIFHLSALDQLFPIFETEEQAISYLIKGETV